MSDQEIIIKAEHLVKKYNTADSVIHALNDVSIEIRKGEFISVTGESGSGKTTLLNVLGSIDNPDSGKIFVNGEDITEKNDDELSAYRRQKVGFIFQNYNLIPVLDVEENIMLPMNLDNTEPDIEYYNSLMKLTGLEKKRNSFPHELSGGQKQRVAFIRALIHKPQIILADEPTGNLDSKNSREIMSILKNSVSKYNQALLLITHDANVAAMADKTLVMHDGRLKEGKK